MKGIEIQELKKWKEIFSGKIKIKEKETENEDAFI